VSEGRRTLKVNLSRRCTMCEEDPRLFGQPIKPERIPFYSSKPKAGTNFYSRLMICPIHDRPPMTIRTT